MRVPNVTYCNNVYFVSVNESDPVLRECVGRTCFPFPGWKGFKATLMDANEVLHEVCLFSETTIKIVRFTL